MIQFPQSLHCQVLVNENTTIFTSMQTFLSVPEGCASLKIFRVEYLFTIVIAVQ